MNKLIQTLLFAICLSLSAYSVAAPVNVNTADAAAIAANIKGVGLKKAKAIVKYRQTHGDFSSVDDLTKVRGIGAKTIEKNRDNLRLSDY